MAIDHISFPLLLLYLKNFKVSSAATAHVLKTPRRLVRTTRTASTACNANTTNMKQYHIQKEHMDTRDTVGIDIMHPGLIGQSSSQRFGELDLSIDLSIKLNTASQILTNYIL